MADTIRVGTVVRLTPSVGSRGEYNPAFLGVVGEVVEPTTFSRYPWRVVFGGDTQACRPDDLTVLWSPPEPERFPVGEKGKIILNYEVLSKYNGRVYTHLTTDTFFGAKYKANFTEEELKAALVGSTDGK